MSELLTSTSPTSTLSSSEPPPFGSADSARATAESAPDSSGGATTQSTHVVMIRPWLDPVVDDDGHDPRSRYVETFWLGVLGPTATWLIRRLAAGLDQRPDGYELDLAATARAMGLGFADGRSSPFSKALQRCVMFGLAHPIPAGLAVRRRLPPIAHRHLRRMPVDLQNAHAAWAQTTITLDALTRAHRLAAAMAEAGDDTSVIEHQLIAVGVCDAVAAEAADNLLKLASP